jgi:hypothetical protein
MRGQPLRLLLALTVASATPLAGAQTGGHYDLSLRVERETFLPDGSEIVRLEMSNPGPAEVSSRVVATECREFEPGLLFLTAFTIEAGFEGACEQLPDDGCVNFTGTNYDMSRFRLGPAPADGEASCLLKLRPRADEDIRSPEPVAISFEDANMTLPGGGQATDPNPANDAASLSLGRTGPLVPCEGCEGLEILSLPASGIWRNPEASGTGLMLQVQNGLMMGAYFGYGADGKALWYMFNGRLEPAPGAPDTLRVTAPLERLENGACLGCEYRAPQIFRDVGIITLEFDQRSYGWFSIDGGIRTAIVPLIAGVETSTIRPGSVASEYAAPDLSGNWVLAVHDAAAPQANSLTARTVRLTKRLGLHYSIETFAADFVVSAIGSIACGIPYVGPGEPEPPPRCHITLDQEILGVAPAQTWEVLPLPYANIGDNRVISVHPASGIRVEFFRLDYD